MTNVNTSENTAGATKEELWYLNNYVLLRDYYDRTISRIAARCVRKGNIAMEDYPFYTYILDVLEEISEVGDYILSHKVLYPYIEKKIVGGVEGLKKNLKEYKDELLRNSSPDMIREDGKDVERMKELLGDIDSKPAFDPTKGAGMSMDELMNKLMGGNPAENQQEQQPEIKKVIKIKKPVSAVDRQAVPEKSEAEE